MKIALTYNLKRHAGESHAEFDSAETIAMLAGMLRSLGHVIVLVEVARPIDELVMLLNRARPDMVFNLAEGERGRFREAFYPALFEQLRLPHTGSDAGTLALCLDKSLANRVASAAGVRTAESVLVTSLDAMPNHIALPAIVKPNFEGSSKGITQASVIDGGVDGASRLRGVVARLLSRYPSGVLIEQFIRGVDIAMGWIEGIGLLPSIRYRYESRGPHAIYDYALKQSPTAVQIEVPAQVDEATARALELAASRTFAALGVRGFGRADFRVTPTGEVYFLDMNPLPSLTAEDEELFVAAGQRGHQPRDVLAAILRAGAGAGAAAVAMPRRTPRARRPTTDARAS